MFRTQKDIQNEIDVGHYVEQLQKDGVDELENFIIGEEDGLAIDSTEPTLRTDETDEL